MRYFGYFVKKFQLHICENVENIFNNELEMTHAKLLAASKPSSLFHLHSYIIALFDGTI